MKTRVVKTARLIGWLNRLVRWGALTLLACTGAVQAQTADVQALTLTLNLPVGEPRGQQPSALIYQLFNAGPANLSSNAYLIELFLATNGAVADSGTRLGGYTNTLTLVAGQTNNTVANLITLGQFVVPTNMTAGLYQTWLHTTPLTGAPADTITNNDWVAGNAVLIPNPGTGKLFNFGLYAGKLWTVGNADGLVGSARFNDPYGIATDGAGNLYVADTLNHTIRKITSAGIVSTIAGWPGSRGSVDGFGNAARFNTPSGVAVAPDGTVYVADQYNHAIRKISPAGIVSTLAGSAGNPGNADGFGTSAQFIGPCAVAVDGSGNVLVADTWNHTIRKITPAGWVTTLAGSANSQGSADGLGTSARFYAPQGIAVDGSGNIFVADTGNHTLRRISSGGMVTTLAGVAGVRGGLDGTGAGALLNNPVGLTVDSTGYIYIADAGNHAIRGVTSAGGVTTLGGLLGSGGFANGIGSAARFNGPQGVAVDAIGNLFVADAWNSIIRKGTPVETAPVVVLANPTNAGTASGTGYYAVGSQAQIGASANLGWRFLNWSDGGADNPRLVTVASNGAAYTANFEFITNATVNVLLQAGNGGMVGVWGLGPTYQPATWTTVAGTLGGGWVVRALDSHRMLLQQGTGGMIGIWDTIGNIPVQWWPVSGALPGWIARDFDENRILLQAGDGGMIGIWTLDGDNHPASWSAVSGPISGLIARALDGNRIMLQFGTGSSFGYWTLDGGNHITAWTPISAALPTGWILRSLTHDYVLLQAGDGGMAGIWDIDATGRPIAWHSITGPLPGWILRGIEQH